MDSKIRVGVLFGGNSSEHEVSCLSGWSVLQHIDTSIYDVIPIIIDKQGAWHAICFDSLTDHLAGSTPFEKGVEGTRDINEAWLDPSWQSGGPLFSPSIIKDRLDIAFIMMHGPPGEDGSLAGLFSYLGIPVVGSGVMASAICMNKGMSKKIVASHGIEVAPYQEVQRGDKIDETRLIEQLGLPLFVKPIDMGSSIGIAKVYRASELKGACQSAFEHGATLLIESMVEGREIEVAVFEKEGKPLAAPIGEIISGSDYYSYSAKYDKASQAKTRLVDDVEESLCKHIQHSALKIFDLLGCAGMARIDFFLSPGNRVVFNEINTLPGFTNISMFPMMVKAMGISQKELINILIETAVKSSNKKQLLTLS